MEAHQEKPDDPSDHYGGLRETVMNQQITECIDNLLAAVQSSQEYHEFIKIKEILEQDPELLSRVNAFRNSNFKLQNDANREDLFQATEQLNRESRELRRIPQVNAYLDAELALCKLMQGICKKLTSGIDLDIPDMQ